MDEPKVRHFWFKASIVLGVLLGLVLVFQTVLTYRFVADSMVKLEARREATARCRRSSGVPGRRGTVTLRHFIP